ncbi:MAG: BatD family protein [Sulfurospirillaceae bacterium]|nr:BatD family protein [Sulfurospirillaceae bacterium]
MQLHGRFWFLLWMATTTLFGAQAFLQNPSIYEGQEAILVLKATGEKIEFPNISSIEGNDIVSKQERQSVEFINGKVKKEVEKRFGFYPKQDFEIPSYEIIVDGKKELTEPIRVVLKKENEQPKSSSTKEPFSLLMRVSNENPMQNEAVKLDIVFKRDKRLEVVDIRFSPPVLDGFWVKEGEKKPVYEEDGFMVHSLSYYVFPQKAGDLSIEKAKIELALPQRDSSNDMFRMFVSQVRWKSVFSNPITLHVEPLEGTNLYGDFSLNITADKREIGKNEAVNVLVEIKGEGNFDDISSFSLVAKGANIFADEPKVKSYIQKDKLMGQWSQKFSLSGAQDFTIEPLVLTFFDAKKRALKTLKTEPIDIKVSGDAQKEESIKYIFKTESNQSAPIQETQNVAKNGFDMVSFAFGFALAIALLVGFFIFKKVFSFKKFQYSERALLKMFLKHKGKNEAIDKIIMELEENIYRGGTNRINKRATKKILEDFV